LNIKYALFEVIFSLFLANAVGHRKTGFSIRFLWNTFSSSTSVLLFILLMGILEAFACDLQSRLVVGLTKHDEVLLGR